MHPTGKSVLNGLEFLFTDVKMPFMSPRKTQDSDSPFTVGDNVAMKMSQRTLVLILGGGIALALAWANLKAESSKSRELILELTAVRANDALERKADHDLLIRVANGVDRLERRAEREDRRAATTNRP